jgi:hypothetical protein
MSNEVSYIQSPFNKSRKDKFLMVFSMPPMLRPYVSKFYTSEKTFMPDALQFSIYGAIVPSIEVPAVNVRYSGQTLSQSSHSRTVYEPNTVNFTVDNRYSNYWVIYTWLSVLNNDMREAYDNINPPLGDLVPPGPNLDYRTDISVFALDEYNKKVMEFLYKDAFPTQLGGISFNYRDPGEIESSFTYAYSQLVVKPVDPGIESL